MRSIATLEDPVEAVVAGSAQSAVNPAAGFDYETGLKSLLRQDPEVIMVGEIRDPGTAALVFQAARAARDDRRMELLSGGSILCVQ